MPLQLQVVTPKGAKVVSDASQVTAPGTVGELGILPGHRPLITSLGIGLFSYDTPDGRKNWLAVNGGYMEIADDAVIVITETAESPDEVDVDRAKEALKRAEQRLKEIGQEQVDALRFAEEAKKRAENRIAAAKLAKFIPPP